MQALWNFFKDLFTAYRVEILPRQNRYQEEKVSPLTNAIDELGITDEETLAFFSLIKNKSKNYKNGAMEDTTVEEDGFYHIEEFEGSDRAGIEFVDEIFNCQQLEVVARHNHSTTYKYQKIDPTKRAFIYSAHQDHEFCVLCELI